MKGRVLVAGFATRHVVCSAVRAGYEVYAIDHFCDQDLCAAATAHSSFEELADLPELIAGICADHSIDWFVGTSGAEMLTVPVRRAGTTPKISARFLDKEHIQEFFEENGIPAPCRACGTYPAMLKPRHGAGGWRNRLVHSAADVTAWEEEWPEVPSILQEVIDGVPASVSCIADGHRAVAIAVNDQILRGGDGNRAFGFSGSITPSDHPAAEAMMAIAEQAVALSGCVGSVGVDFMVGEDGVRAIEINPRFQGTLDTVEAATGLNLFDLHIEACTGILPERRPAAQRACARAILFADRDLTVERDLMAYADCCADIPWPGTSIEEGSAVVSVYGRGADRAAACSELDRNITRLRQYIS
ncbi:ATP-grasp domain-containing protein [Methanofollis fontis]|uniref:ATP-dependent carboligase n=1 Tax=Methanofollis fontis TaxID=2052832 RepID=A0A483CTL2_9EURY|nr:ATP-grasp domain-containing protein [Methanofollis fontis]TAJ44723.1 ATP-dependent carboligase [Methanofollis fontis]